LFYPFKRDRALSGASLPRPSASVQGAILHEAPGRLMWRAGE
jgi:hypothetical protein